MRKRFWILVTVLLVIGMIPASGLILAQDMEPIHVDFASDGFLLGSQSWVSMERGFFEEEGIEANVSLYGTGIEAIQAVIARQADVGPALDFAVLNLAAAAEENMVVVGAIGTPNPGFHSLAVRNEINGPEDLVGTTIGYVQGTSEHFVTIRYLEQNGISLDDVELVSFPGLFELVGALRTNDIQAAWVWLSGTQQANEDESLKILTTDVDVLDTVAIYLIANTEWTENNQEALTRILRAYDRASEVLNEETEVAAQIVADAVSGDAELFANFIPNQRYGIGFGQVQLDSLDAIAQFLIDTDVLPEDFNIRNFIDFRAMEVAVPGSVTADLGGDTSMQEDMEPIHVDFASDGFLLGSQSWVSMERGFFEEEGIEANVSLYGTGIEAIQAVIARQADVGPALDFAVLNLAAAAEENMVVVGAIGTPNPGFHSLAVRNEINGPEDLVGTTIGYVQGTSEHFVTIRYLEQNGISLDDVELVSFPGLFELVGALRTNDIQAAWVWLSGTQQANEDESLKILTTDVDVLDTVAIYLIANTEWTENNQEALTRILRAYDRASEVLNEETEVAAQIVADAVSGDAELFANFIPNQRYGIGFGQVQLDSLDAIAQFLIDTDVLPEDFNIRNFIDFRAMEVAVPGSVTADLDN